MGFLLHNLHSVGEKFQLYLGVIRNSHVWAHKI